MAVSDVVRLAGGLVAHRTTQTTAAYDIRVHETSFTFLFSESLQNRTRQIPRVVLYQFGNLRRKKFVKGPARAEENLDAHPGSDAGYVPATAIVSSPRSGPACLPGRLPGSPPL